MCVSCFRSSGNGVDENGTRVMEKDKVMKSEQAAKSVKKLNHLNECACSRLLNSPTGLLLRDHRYVLQKKW